MHLVSTSHMSLFLFLNLCCLCACEGTSRELSDVAQYDFKWLAGYLQKNYTTYSEGIRYLRELAGEISRPPGPLPTIQRLGKHSRKIRILQLVENNQFQATTERIEFLSLCAQGFFSQALRQIFSQCGLCWTPLSHM